MTLSELDQLSRDELYQAIDALWGALAVDEVIALVSDDPQAVEIAKAAHERVWHEA